MGTGLYLTTKSYPTRSGSNMVLATWNDYGMEYPAISPKVILYTTWAAPSAIKANSKWKKGEDNPFSDSMTYITRTDITAHMQDGEFYQTWVSAGLTVVFAIFYDEQGSGKHYCSFIADQCSYGDNYITNSAPSLTYSNGVLNIGTCCTGRRIIEFRRRDIPYGGNTGITDEATLNEMFYTSLLQMERSNPYQGYYYLSNNPRLSRWAPGAYTVGVNFVTSRNQSVISGCIDSSIAKINDVMNEFGVSFTRRGTTGDISITVDAEDVLFSYRSSGKTIAGAWSTTKSNGVITSATIKYANDFQDYAFYNSYEHVVFEELIQCMGAGYDQNIYMYDTIHTDFNYYNNLNFMYKRDADILRLVYSPEVSPNDTYAQVARKLNIPCGCYLAETTTYDTARTVKVSSFLSQGGRYDVRVFIVNSSGRVSAASNWISVDVPAIQVWDWTKSNGNATNAETQHAYSSLHSGGKVSGFSYVVWNDMCDKTIEVLRYIGKAWNAEYRTFAKTKMSAYDKTLTAARFNSLRYNISRIYTIPGVTTVNSGDIVYANYFIKLANSINNGIYNLQG